MPTPFHARFREHSPGDPMPVEPDRAVWVLTVGNQTPSCIRASDVDWRNTTDTLRDVVLAWAPVVETENPLNAAYDAGLEDAARFLESQPDTGISYPTLSRHAKSIRSMKNNAP